MDIGTDTDGRPITYDQTTEQFSIGGIMTTIDRLAAYDRGGQINWSSDEVRDWAHEFALSRQEFATQQHDAREAAAAQAEARQREAARRLKLTAQGYNPDSVVKFASSMKGLATTIMVLFTVGGVVEGLVFGALVVRWAPGAMLVAPVISGLVGYLIGYLATMFMKAAADMLLAIVQIEMNTRHPESPAGVA